MLVLLTVKCFKGLKDASFYVLSFVKKNLYRSDPNIYFSKNDGGKHVQCKTIDWTKLHSCTDIAGIG